MMATPEEKAGTTSQFLNAELPKSQGQPTWNYWYPWHPVTRASLTGVDGKEYILVADENRNLNFQL